LILPQGAETLGFRAFFNALSMQMAKSCHGTLQVQKICLEFATIAPYRGHVCRTA
jgi:hypothetical protein